MTFVLVAPLLGLAVCAAIALAAPLRVDLELDAASETSMPSLRVHAHWLWFNWRSGQARRVRRERPPRPPPRQAGKPQRGHVLAALRTRGFLARVGRLAIELWRTLAPRTVDGWVRFGFDDPVSTGVLCGAVQGAAVVSSATALEPAAGAGVRGPGVRWSRAVHVGRAPWRRAVAGRDVHGLAHDVASGVRRTARAVGPGGF